MAVTIVRTPWQDDDGSGQTGTVLNNAVKTELYGQIDGALAQVAQLTGGNIMSGGISVLGQLFVSPTSYSVNAQIGVAVDALTRDPLVIKNQSATNTGNYIVFHNSAAGVAGYITQTGATTIAYNTTSDARLKADAGRATDLAALRAVVVHDFQWRADGRPDRGIFAQEAHAVFPRAVTAGTDETTEAGHLARPWMTDYSKFVADLIVGWQQHDAAIAELRAARDARRIA